MPQSDSSSTGSIQSANYFNLMASRPGLFDNNFWKQQSSLATVAGLGWQRDSPNHHETVGAFIWDQTWGRRSLFYPQQSHSFDKTNRLHSSSPSASKNGANLHGNLTAFLNRPSSLIWIIFEGHVTPWGEEANRHQWGKKDMNNISDEYVSRRFVVATKDVDIFFSL